MNNIKVVYYYLLVILLAFCHAGCTPIESNKIIIHYNDSGIEDSISGKRIMPSVATWRMDTSVVNLAYRYTPFSVLFNLRNIGFDKDVMRDDVYHQIKKTIEHANRQGILMVADLDIRQALPAFEAKYPNELQQALVLKEVELNGTDTISVLFCSRHLNDHYQHPYQTRASSFVKAFGYKLTRSGLIDPSSLTDISEDCIVDYAEKDRIQLKMSQREEKLFTNAIFIVSFTYLYPDLFSPYLMDFEKEIIRKYSDVKLAGALKDEWGFPQSLSELDIWDEYWYSPYMAEAYALKTGGRVLLDDILLMYRGIESKENERIFAINHFGEMTRQRNQELEENYYSAAKEVFGEEGIVGVHATWFPYPERREFKKNGLSWWVAKRDWAQVDEVTPFGARTSLAKKWGSPVWYNMYYRFGSPQGIINVGNYERTLWSTANAGDSEQELWSSVLAGGRVNNMSGPRIGSSGEINPGILSSNFITAENRIRLLNYIDPVPLNCPVAVVFGHAAAMNWAWPGFDDVGMQLVDSLWHMGIPADLIPSSEIVNNSLKVDKEGFVNYGGQRYAAVILYHPEFENEEVALFFKKVSGKKTRLFRIGEWTKNFFGEDFNGNAALPSSMAFSSSIKSVLDEIPIVLDRLGIPKTTPATRVLEGFGHASLTPPPTGYSYLMDGTLIQVAGTNDAAGDPIRTTKKIGKYTVTFDAIGIAAVRLDKKGKLQALAASGLKSFQTNKLQIDLDERIDLALWIDENGELKGVIQGLKGEIPSQLQAITKNWERINLPENFKTTEESILSTRTGVHLNEIIDFNKTIPDGSDIITDIDGNKYHVVQIGDQTWMAENLRTSKLNDGMPLAYSRNNIIEWKNSIIGAYPWYRFQDGMPLVSSKSNQDEWLDSISGAYTWYENDSTRHENTVGKLYNWRSIETAKLCPVGWRIPDEKDWKSLIDYLKVNYNYKDGGFNPIAAGYMYYYGNYLLLGKYGIWWTSSETKHRMVWDQSAKYFYLVYDSGVSRDYFFSVRCLQRKK